MVGFSVHNSLILDIKDNSTALWNEKKSKSFLCHSTHLHYLCKLNKKNKRKWETRKSTFSD